MNWDSQFPFTQEEVGVFAALQTKATKFPLPKHLKERSAEKPASIQPPVQVYRTQPEIDHENIKADFEHLQNQFMHTQQVLRQLDLLLEAHRQLHLLSTPTATQEPSTSPSPSPSAAKSELLSKLAEVQGRLASLEEHQKAEAFLKGAIMPSLTASPTFFAALQCLHRTGGLTAPLQEKTRFLMKRCWSNTIAAMERVLDTDLDTIEAYMDDRSYTELKEKMLKPLLQIIALDPNTYADCLLDFTVQYAQLRQNSIRFLMTERQLGLDSMFSTSPPQEQITHLIERTRLLMQVEAREFDDLFTRPLLPKSHARNEILETVGNLLYSRIENLSKGTTETRQVAFLIQSLLESLLLLQSNTNDPFALFLQLLQRNLFPLPSTVDQSDTILEV